jgi:hypothetical protein
MACLRYCCLVVWTAFRHSVSWTQFTIAVAVVIAGAAIWLMPYFGMTVDPSGLVAELRSPTTLAVLAGAIVLFRLACSPYWIWRDDQNAIAKSALEITRLTSTYCVLSINSLKMIEDHGRECWQLSVVNRGPAAALTNPVRASALLSGTTRSRNRPA